MLWSCTSLACVCFVAEGGPLASLLVSTILHVAGIEKDEQVYDLLVDDGIRSMLD